MKGENLNFVGHAKQTCTLDQLPGEQTITLTYALCHLSCTEGSTRVSTQQTPPGNS